MIKKLNQKGAIMAERSSKEIQIYTLSHPITDEIRYVGKTTWKFSYRLNAHLVEARRGESKSHRNSWLLSLLDQGLRPKIESLDSIISDDWEWLEQYWISQLRVWGLRLTNMTDGGDGNKNQVWSRETIEKRTKKLRGQKRSQEVRNRISEGLKGKSKSDAHREKLRQANLGKRRVGSKVQQFDKEGNFIAEFESISKAAEETGCFACKISDVCRRWAKTHHDFIWKYKPINQSI